MHILMTLYKQHIHNSIHDLIADPTASAMWVGYYSHHILCTGEKHKTCATLECSRLRTILCELPKESFKMIILDLCTSL